MPSKPLGLPNQRGEVNKARREQYRVRQKAQLSRDCDGGKRRAGGEKKKKRNGKSFPVILWKAEAHKTLTKSV